ncbi:MAG TPA: tail fiber protein [Pyrinomonadaceae bacterium]
MSSPFVAEIRIFAGNFAPTGWATCDGQLLPISQNTALFSLLGTMYGGDGKSTFALPNLQGSAPMMWGQGPGLSLRDEGENGGEQFVSLIQSEMPAHTHQAIGNAAPGGANSPANATWASMSVLRQSVNLYTTTANAQMSPFAFAIAGGGLPHNNMHPYLTLTFIIALQGVFPPRG